MRAHISTIAAVVTIHMDVARESVCRLKKKQGKGEKEHYFSHGNPHGYGRITFLLLFMKKTKPIVKQSFNFNHLSIAKKIWVLRVEA